MKRQSKTLLIWIAAGLFMLLAFSMLSSSKSGPVQISASEFIELVNKGQITEARFIGNVVIGKVKPTDGNKATEAGRVSAQVSFSGAKIIESLNNKEVPFSEEMPADFGWVWSVIWIALIIGLVLMLMRRGSAGSNQMSRIGKHKGMEVSKQVKVRFSDVAGADEAKREVSEIVDYLRAPDSFSSLGAKAPKGVLLMGTPGTGKTLLARAVAGEAGVPFTQIAGSEFVELYVGVGAARVRSLFEEAKKHAPCIIFIDEIDAVGRQRGGGKGNSHDEREQTLNQILTEMDGFEDNSGVVVIAATNRPDILDNALLRPGRFDRKVVMPRPDVNGRLAILKIHARSKPLADDVDLETLAKTTTNMSGADLEYIMNEAAILAVRYRATEISMKHLDEARDKSIMGAERRSQVLSQKIKRVIAWHEAGHALVGHLTPGCHSVERITIIPRGQALGVTVLRPDEDIVLQTKSELMGRMRMLMGGRMAEIIRFGEDYVTTGASNDIRRATEIAASMVKEYGMTKLGYRSFINRESGFVYDMTERQFSDDKAREIDATVGELVEQAAADAKQMLKKRRQQLDQMANLLLECETIDGKAVYEILGPRPEIIGND